MPERTLVTGALGCVGAWTLKALLELGEEPVGYDLGGDDSRLRLVLDDDEHARVTLVEGDVTNGEMLGRALDEHEITRVVHLAALQVPFCRENPVRGAHVNVLGTVVVFEAVKARLDRIPGLAYASSTAVYNASDPSPAPETGGTAPSTLYGVYKLANEGTARVFWHDDGVPSIGIRPYVVYGRAAIRGSRQVRRSRWRPWRAASSTRSRTEASRNTTMHPMSATPSRWPGGQPGTARMWQTSQAFPRR